MKYRFFSLLLCFACLAAVAQERNEANYDESKVPEYKLPELLLSSEGKKIRNVRQWEKIRRDELLGLFETEVYGKMPEGDVSVKYNVLEEAGEALNGKAVRRQVELLFNRNGKECKALLLMYMPAKLPEFPVFLHFNFQGNQTVSHDPAIIPSAYSTYPRGNQINRWPVEMIIDAGYALATVHYWDFYPDNLAMNGLEQSVWGLWDCTPEKLAPDATIAIGAWAWGSSRVLDYLETVAEVDASKVALVGHSRLGKAALWAGAQDERFATVISNESGCLGAALSMRRYGETLNIINKSFPHWFCNNNMKYCNNEGTLPVDQHMLLALIAPRPLYVASAEADRWADPYGEYLSAFHASEVYGLYGYTGIETTDRPEVNTPVMNRVGYHIRPGKHDVTDYDWDCFIAFCDKWFK